MRPQGLLKGFLLGIWGLAVEVSNARSIAGRSDAPEKRALALALSLHVSELREAHRTYS